MQSLVRIRHIRRAGGLNAEAVMSRWTDEELRELAALWQECSLSEIVERLHRPRWAIRSKAKRLCLDRLRPHIPSEDVEVLNPPKRRWQQNKITRTSPTRVNVGAGSLFLSPSDLNASTQTRRRPVVARQLQGNRRGVVCAGER